MRPFGRPPGTAYSYFNPRIPQGMRRSTKRREAMKWDFNPRIPQGMRPIVRAAMEQTENFNPRIPQGMRPMLVP